MLLRGSDDRAPGTIRGPITSESPVIAGNRIQPETSEASVYADCQDDCHAEGRGFESDQPLSRTPAKLQGFLVADAWPGVSRGDSWVPSGCSCVDARSWSSSSAVRSPRPAGADHDRGTRVLSGRPGAAGGTRCARLLARQRRNPILRSVDVQHGLAADAPVQQGVERGGSLVPRTLELHLGVQSSLGSQ
jgi:hypothetical protein